MSAKATDVGIAGAGLVGSLLGVFLSQRGCSVTIYEKRGDPRKGVVDSGRSINLALSDRGWKALRGVGLEDSVRKLAIPMKGRLMHSEEGQLAFQPYGLEGQAIYSVSRSGLNMALMNAAEQAGAQIRFEQAASGVDLESNQITTDKGERFTHSILFGADGAFSAVRHAMMMTERFEYNQHYLEHGYKELSIPPDEGGGWRLEKNALHIWPRHSFMLIALPNLDGSFTCTLFFPFEGNRSFERLKSESDVASFFNEHFPDAVEHMPTLIEDYFSNPTSSLITVKCYPWTHRDNVALIGDAAHAIVPFYGQGMNAGFEDCSVLHDLLDKHDWPDALHAYERSRKPNGDAIAELAFRNFVEMRDRVADADFLVRKKLFTALHEAFPGEFIPVYSMVTFTHVDYAEALRQASLQDAFYEQIKSNGLLIDSESPALLNQLIDVWRMQFA